VTVKTTSQNSEAQVTPASNMQTKKRCHFEGCTKSVKLVDEVLKCRCEGVFCKNHRDVIAHRCSQNVPSSASTKKATQVYESALHEGSAF
jgi:hypothetical protein